MPDAGGGQAKLSQDDPPFEAAVAMAWCPMQVAGRPN